MSKRCERDSYWLAQSIAGMATGETTQYKCYGHTPFKMFSFDNPLTRKNKFGRLNHCGATLIGSVSSTSKLPFCNHNLSQKIAKQIQSRSIFKNLIIGYSRLKVFVFCFHRKLVSFLLFFLTLSSLNIFLTFSDFFLAYKGYHKLPFETSFV